MASINIFAENADTFKSTELTEWVQDRPSLPSMIGDMNMFEDKPVRSKNIFIDRSQDNLELIGFSERGGDVDQNERGDRQSISLTIPRMGLGDKVWANEIAGLRATGSETELMAVATEVRDRLVNMQDKLAYTEEYLRLAAIQGKVLNPKDGTDYVDYYTALDITPPAVVELELGTSTTNVKQKVEEMLISVQRGATGAWVQGVSEYIVLCSDTVWFALTSHPNVEKFYQNHAAMMELKGLTANDEFPFAGVIFKRFVGSDDNSTVAIPNGKARGFIRNGRKVFQRALAPADEHMSYVNTRGQSMYVIPKRDHEYPENPRFMGFNVLAYPLYMCLRPQTLREFNL